jgi:hypothetical protein
LAVTFSAMLYLVACVVWIAYWERPLVDTG